jgi:hypothetical protein
LAIAPYSDGSGAITLHAIAQQGLAGTAQDWETITLTGIHENLNFSIPASQSFSIAENAAGPVLFGFGTIPVTDGTGDALSYTIVSGNPAISATDTQSLFSLSDTGVFYVNGPTPWSPTTDTYHLSVKVSDGAYTHTDQVSVHITDNSPPLLRVTETPGTKGTQGSITLTATDPHGLAVRLSILSQTDGSGAKPYFIAGQSTTDGTVTGHIWVPHTAPIASGADTITLAATDTQGLVTTQTIVFFPDIIGALQAGTGEGALPPAPDAGGTTQQSYLGAFLSTGIFGQDHPPTEPAGWLDYR